MTSFMKTLHFLGGKVTTFFFNTVRISSDVVTVLFSLWRFHFLMINRFVSVRVLWVLVAVRYEYCRAL